MCQKFIFRKSTIGPFLIQVSLYIGYPFKSLILICLVSVKKVNTFFFISTLCKTKQPLQGMKSQQREEENEERCIGEMIT